MTDPGELTLEQLLEVVAAQQVRIEELLAVVAAQAQQIEQQAELIAARAARIVDLERQLGRNSNNSSQPPS